MLCGATAATDTLSTPQADTTTILNPEQVEQLPEFSGGQRELGRFLHEKLSYPKEAYQKNIQGRVFVSFVIDTAGNVTQTELMNGGVHRLLDKEALRVVAAMPRWTPAKLNGKAVKVRYSLPVIFKIDQD